MAITYHAGRRIQGISADEYKIHKFTSTGSSTFQVTSGSGDVDVLIVGGGGAGGNSLAGGGGGGGVGIANSFPVSTTSYTVVVGSGGQGASGQSGKGGNGGDSSVFGQTISGGMGGKDRNDSSGTTAGANGGGGSTDSTSGTSGTQDTAISGFTTYGGKTGGDGVSGGNNYPGGGGAGSGSNGETPSSSSSKAGDGGDGIQSDILGINYYWGGGGGGSSYTNSVGAGNGGSGGGGGGSSSTTSATATSGGSGYNTGGAGATTSSTGNADGGAGGANTGGGGGASSHASSGGDNYGGDGGSGIVIIRYKTSSNISATGGTITTTNVPINKPTNVQFGSRFEETDTRKMYSLSNMSTSGLKAYYNFDSIDSSTTLTNQATTGDGLGSSADGTVTNATLDTTNEKLGTGCYNFDGNGDKVALGSSTTTLDFLTTGNSDWTVSFWMKLNATEPNGNNAILCQGQGNEAGLDILFDDRSAESRDHVLGVRLEGNSGNTAMKLYTSAQFIPKDTDWHHYVITGDVSTRTVTAYRDGGNAESDSTGSGNFPTTLARKPTFGVHPTSGFNGADLNAKLDDCSLWSRILTSDEISLLYNSGTGETPYNAISWQEIGT